jgi:bacterioferritin (cytochrome b1)
MTAKKSKESKLVQELAALAKDVEALYYQTEDKAEKEKLRTYYKELSDRLETAVRMEFDKNDKSYKAVIEKLKATKKEIVHFLETQMQLVELFGYLSDLTAQLDGFIYGWRAGVKKS